MSRRKRAERAVIARPPTATPSRRPSQSVRAWQRGSCRRRRDGCASARRASPAPPRRAPKSARRAARAGARRRSAARSTAAAAGRRTDRRQAGSRCCRARRPRAPPRSRRRRRDSAPRSRGSRRPSVTASERPGGRDSAPARRAWRRRRRSQGRAARPSIRTRPATSRSSDDLPAPFGPLTSRASPAPNAKLRPANTLRPPRTQARSVARSRVGRRIGRIRASCAPIGRSRSLPGRPKAGRPVPWKPRHFQRILLMRIDFLEPREKSPYKPVHSGARRERPDVATRRPGAFR